MRARLWLLAGSAATAALAWHLGWASGERPFEEATGWREIPDELRPAPGLPWPAGAGGPPRLGWLGHAGLVVDWHGTRLVFDPNLSPRCTLARRVLERTARPETLGAFDALVVTHAHFDHLDRPTVERLAAVAEIVLPAGSEEYVRGWRRDAAVVGAVEGDVVVAGALELVAVPAFHHGNRYHPLASARRALGWIVRPRQGADSIYVAGDTGAANDFAAIGRRHHPTLAVLPIGAYLPPWPIGRVHLSPEQAVAAARALGAAAVVPYHFGTFALALDRPTHALPTFARAARVGGVAWAMPEPVRR